MPIYKDVLRARRRARRTIADVAREAGVDPIHLSRFEKGERGMGSDKLEAVLKALGLRVQQVPSSEPDESFEDAPTEFA